MSTVPIKGESYRIIFPILDADGDLVSGATGLDSERSIDGGLFADCMNEATEIASSGMYSLDLTADEMNGDVITVIVKSAEGKTTPIVLYTSGASGLPSNVLAVDTAAVSAIQAGLATSAEVGAVDALIDSLMGAGWTDETLVALKSAIDAKLDADDYTAPDNQTIAEIVDKIETGSGSVARTYQVTDEATGAGIPAVFVTVTGDLFGQTIVASGYTDSQGKVTFHLDPGTYYIWRRHSGYTFSDPDQEIVE